MEKIGGPKHQLSILEITLKREMCHNLKLNVKMVEL